MESEGEEKAFIVLCQTYEFWTLRSLDETQKALNHYSGNGNSQKMS